MGRFKLIHQVGLKMSTSKERARRIVPRLMRECRAADYLDMSLPMFKSPRLATMRRTRCKLVYHFMMPSNGSMVPVRLGFAYVRGLLGR
jgi:hypothetical protein